MSTDYYLLRCDATSPTDTLRMGDVQAVKEAISRASPSVQWSESDPLHGGWVATDGYLIELNLLLEPEGQVDAVCISPHGTALADVGRILRTLCEVNGWRCFDPQWGDWIAETDWAGYGAWQVG